MMMEAGIPFRPPSAGFFGKLPSEADFVGHGLSEPTVAALDQWCRECLLNAGHTIGQHWRSAWMVAPVWHFALPPGACGPHALLGAWLPSMDRVGRCYPFMVCAQAPDLARLLDGGTWLERAAEAAIRSVVEDAATTTLRQILDEPAPSRHLPMAPGWWTDGGPLRCAAILERAYLPSTEQVADMIRDNDSSYVTTEVI